MLSEGQKLERFEGVLINARSQLLLQRSETDFFGDRPWAFVKGLSNKGETPEQSALRMIYEETGYQARIIAALGDYDGSAPATTLFLMEPVGRRTMLKKQAILTRWLSFEEAATFIAQAKDSTDRNCGLATLRAAEQALQNLSNFDRPATCEEDWRTIPMPARRKRIDLNVRYDETAMARIRKGFLPKEMEDHWFAWFEDPFLHLHRSWTGFCIYEVKLIREGEIWVARYALVNQDPTQYACADDKKEVQTLLRGIDELLLNRADTSLAEPMSPSHAIEPVTYKVGPMPPMPPLPPTPYPYTRPYVFTDGTVGFADGFLQAMQLEIFERAGLARKVPFGIEFETDEQKLWLLGRKAFAPHFTHDVNKIAGAKADVDDILNADVRSADRQPWKE
jgi:8-oxo-dGTP pyrophosphatase MutT (NUDIX family)